MELQEYRLVKWLFLMGVIFFFFINLFSIAIFLLVLTVYLWLASASLLNRMVLSFLSLFKRSKSTKENFSYSVILPVKNEDKKIFQKCITSLLKQKGNYQILIGDDGSNPKISTLLTPSQLSQLTIIRSEKSVGKKEMQIKMLELAVNKIVIQMDSDVILKTRNDLNNLSSHFKKDKVAVVNGNGRIISNNSILQRIQQFQYFCANDIGRSGMGFIGLNPCATGELVAFRGDIFKKLIEEYRYTTHLGKLMNFGEDRLMTNLFLREGYKSVFAEEVIFYTFPKKTLKSLLKQQMRWKRSGIREAIRCCKEVKNPYLKVWSMLNVVLPMVFYVLFLIILFSKGYYGDYRGILIMFVSLATISMISETPLFIRQPKMIVWSIPYFVFNIVFITPMWFVSALTQDETNWGSRS